VVPAQPADVLDTFEASLAAEQTAEQQMLRAIMRSVAYGIPIGIAFFIGMLAIAISDKAAWYVWVGLGAVMGLLGAALFGVLGGALMTSHALDEVDRRVHH
jgi:formate/nitrite transporter FocA (FNT family)